MRKQIDLSQYSNQHYLIKMIDKSFKLWTKILKWKVVLYWPHWWTGKKRFPKLGVESFVKNGVRPALIPLLITYFQGQKMKVKWHGVMSKTRKLKGGGPQGSTFGIWEYLRQSNDNANCVNESDRLSFWTTCHF